MLRNLAFNFLTKKLPVLNSVGPRNYIQIRYVCSETYRVQYGLNILLMLLPWIYIQAIDNII
jgi:hypothetical protein